jgi:hypothetical protein
MISHYFLNLKFFFPSVSRSKLRASTNFMILGATDQKLWMFEIFRRSLGKAAMCWSQPARVDHLHKKWRAREKKNSKKRGSLALSRCRPAVGD